MVLCMEVARRGIRPPKDLVKVPGTNLNSSFMSAQSTSRGFDRNSILVILIIVNSAIVKETVLCTILASVIYLLEDLKRMAARNRASLSTATAPRRCHANSCYQR